MRYCKVEGCEGKYRSLGLCSKHYQRFHRTGSTLSMMDKDIRTKISDLIKVNNDGCWVWIGSNDGSDGGGYGTMRFNGRKKRVARFLYEMVTGIKVGNRLVCHKCDNPPCVNPAHLFLGSYKDNTLDMMKKGRCGSSILSDKEVLEIRELHKDGWLGKDLAIKFKLDKSAISLIVNNKRWKHLLTREA